MIERPSAVPAETKSEPPAPAAANPDAALRAQLLATEHWSLLATRSMSWNEAFSRTSMFLSTLSAAVVALALAGPAMAFGGAFALFALIVLSVTLFLGIATYIRLIQVNNEDLYWVSGMNLLRGEYAKLLPGIERSFVSGHRLDTEGMARTFGAFDVTSRPSFLHALVTTPSVVGVISSAIAGVIAGLLTVQFGQEQMLAVALGIIVFVVAVVLALNYANRESSSYINRAIESRVPAADLIDDEPDTT